MIRAVVERLKAVPVRGDRKRLDNVDRVLELEKWLNENAARTLEESP
jgi:hypothetical protein